MGEGSHLWGGVPFIWRGPIYGGESHLWGDSIVQRGIYVC